MASTRRSRSRPQVPAGQDAHDYRLEQATPEQFRYTLRAPPDREVTVDVTVTPVIPVEHARYLLLQSAAAFQRAIAAEVAEGGFQILSVRARYLAALLEILSLMVPEETDRSVVLVALTAYLGAFSDDPEQLPQVEAILREIGAIVPRTEGTAPAPAAPAPTTVPASYASLKEHLKK